MYGRVKETKIFIRLLYRNKSIVEVQYKNHKDAYKSSYYPGVEKIDSHTLLFKTDDFYEVLRTLFFVI
jgi:D-aminopeptidase